MGNLITFLNRLGPARLAAMAVVAVLTLGFLGFITWRATAPNFAPLYSGLAFEDSAAIVSELQSMGAAYELRGEGDTILVDRDQITTIRMQLAEDGLPARGQVGYEIFDQQSTLGATSFVQNINNVRALEGELARTISSLARIRSARVHLVLPERELFRREQQDPSASIVLAVRGELGASEIRAIQHLVASAIEGLTPTRVSIVDDTGRLLASGAGDESAMLSGQAEERTLGVENRLRARVEDILNNVLGDGRARVQVSAELELNQLTTTSQTFDPDGQVVRSQQTRETTNTAPAPGGDGAVSVGNDLPGGAGGDATTSARTDETAEETVNYEISSTTQTQVTEAGSVRRLSVAVVVDGTYVTDAAGAAAYQPRAEAELEQIRALVRSAVGFDASRGDVIEVANMQFASRPELEPLGTAEAGLFDFTRDDLMNGANMLVTLMIALALVFFVMRPLLRRVMAPEAAPLALPQSAELPPNSMVAVGPVQSGSYIDANGYSEPAMNSSQQSGWMNEAKSMGEAHKKTLTNVGNLVNENPKQSAMIVRDWINSNAA